MTAGNLRVPLRFHTDSGRDTPRRTARRKRGRSTWEKGEPGEGTSDRVTRKSGSSTEPAEVLWMEASCDSKAKSSCSGHRKPLGSPYRGLFESWGARRISYTGVVGSDWLISLKCVIVFP